MTNLIAFSLGAGGGLFGAAFGYNMSLLARHLGYAAVARDFSAKDREISILSKDTPEGESARNLFSRSEMIANIFGGIMSMTGLSASMVGSILIGFKYFQESILPDDCLSCTNYSNLKMIMSAGVIFTAAGCALEAYANKTLRQNLKEKIPDITPPQQSYDSKANKKKQVQLKTVMVKRYRKA